MQCLIICNTPYQIFNAVNMVVNEVAGLDRTADILIEEEFSNADSICAKLKRMNLFRKVILAKRRVTITKGKVKSFFRLLYITEELKNYEFSQNEVLHTKYETIFVGDGNLLGQGIYSLNINADVIMFDDGTQSYSMDPIEGGAGFLYKLILKPLRLGVYRYNIKEIYLNNSVMSRCTHMEAKQLPFFRQDNIAGNVLKELFKYDKSKSCLSKRVVLLCQRLSAMKGFNGLDPVELLKNMQIDLSRLVVRIHPGEKKSYENTVIDDGANMWEMECLESITNNHVLIAACSNAQLTPKMLANKEPYLIFLCNLLFERNSKWLEIFNENIDDIKEQYTEQDKIFCPKNLDELKTALLKVEAI